VILERVHRALSRVTSSGRFIPVVDGLRFVAILSVVLYHLNGYLLKKCALLSAADAQGSWLQAILDCGHCGVNLFFVISGFILGLPFAEHYLRGGRAPQLGRYYARRVLRIEPPYVINLLIAFALLLMFTPGTMDSLLPHLAASLFYVHNLVFGEMSKINCVAWSLEVEVQFYLLAPLLAVVFAIRRLPVRRTTIVGCVMLLIALKIFCSEFMSQHCGASIAYFLDHFLVGFLLADIYAGSWKSQPKQHYAWDVVSVAAWCAVAAVHFNPATTPLLPLAILFAYLGAFRGPLSSRIFSRPWIVTVGGMCYTIYLYHFFLISAIGRWTIRLDAGSSYATNMLLQAALILPLILLASAILFLAFEKPFMRKDWHLRCLAALLPVRAGTSAVSPEARLTELPPERP